MKEKFASPVRVLLVSDTHGVVHPRILEAAEACDLVVHAGDIGNAAVLQLLRPRHGEVYAVRGNNDIEAKWPPREREVLRGLPDTLAIALPGGTLRVVHGDRVQPAARRHERLRQLYPQARAVVYGHTHRAVCERDQLPWLLNPGAGGRTRTYGGPACMVLEAGARSWRVNLHRFPLIPG